MIGKDQLPKELVDQDWSQLCLQGSYKVAEFLFDLGKSPTLVHGIADGTDHAWVEVGETVYDVTNKPTVVFPKALYYRELDAQIIDRMTFPEALGKSVISRDVRFWHKEASDDNNPKAT
jgi:hypothetical protein